MMSCAVCNLPLCDVCAAFEVGTKVTCARCATIAARRGRPRWDLAGAFVLAGGGATWALYTSGLAGAFAALVGLATLGIGGLLALPRGEKQTVRPRLPASTSAELEQGAGPYRSSRIRRAPAELVSGRATALLLLGICAGTALALPFSMKLPRWIEWEAVFGIWALALCGTLTTLLYRGWRVADDHRFVIMARDEGPAAPPKDSLGWNWKEDAISVADPEGCLGALAVAVVMLLSFVAAWLFVELVFPLIFFAAYWLVMKAIARVANDRHGCEHDLPKALLWGALWTVTYLGPIAAVVALVHLVVRSR